MKRFFAIFLPVAILIGLGAGGWLVLNSLKPETQKAEEPPKSLKVFAEKVRRDDLKLSVTAQGEVRPRREIIVAPQISGRISYVSPTFIDGGFIRKGQTLIRLESEDYELAIVRAQAGVASAEQRLLREQAEAELALQDIEELGLENASALTRREPQLAEARASLQAAGAQLADAELALKRTAVIAPFTGRVREKTVDVGQFVAPGQSLGRIFATDVVEVSLPVTDDELGRIGLPIAFEVTRDQPGPEVVFSAAVGGKMRHWKGHIVRTSAAVNSQTRLINVIGELHDPYGDGADDGAPMAPGLFVNAEITGSIIEDVLFAPRAALRGKDRIFIGDPETGTLSIRQADVLYTDTEGVYFSSGAEIGELAITSPIQAAFDGMALEVIERAEDGTIITHESEAESDVSGGSALVAGEAGGSPQ